MVKRGRCAQRQRDAYLILLSTDEKERSKKGKENRSLEDAGKTIKKSRETLE